MRHGKERGDYAAPLAFEGPLKGLKKERWPYSCVFEEMKVAKFCDRNKCADISALLLALKDKPAFTSLKPFQLLKTRFSSCIQHLAPLYSLI